MIASNRGATCRRRPARAGPLVAGAALVLAGCAGAPPPAAPPAVDLPAVYPMQAPSAPSASSTAPMRADWWALFDDPALVALVEATLAGNHDLALAAARVDEAEAVLQATRAVQWPQVDLGTSVTRSRSSTTTGLPNPRPEVTSHRIGLSTSFEIDLWGRLRHASRAAQEQLLAATHARDAVRLALAAATAQAWLGVRALDAQIALQAATLQSRQDSLALVQRRADGGIATPLEAAQARAAVAAVAASVPALQQQRQRLLNQIDLLTGRPGQAAASAAPAGMMAMAPGSAAGSPTGSAPGSAPAGGAVPALPAPPAVPAGLPSELLQRRPDIAQAEAQLRAARLQVEVVRASAWPVLSLTGAFGGQSADLVDLLKAGSRVWSIGPALALPLFDNGRSQARTAQAAAQAEQAALGYVKAARTAFGEVADALAGAEFAARREAQTRAQVDAAREVLRVATRRHEAGYSGYLEVLDAQRGGLDAEAALLRAQQERLDASVALFKALGGGWQPAPASR